MPTNPSQSIIDYFKWKAQNVPTGTPSLDPNNPNDPPNIDLNVPPLSEAEYLTQKSSIYEYVNQEYIDQAGLKDSAILDVDKLNTKYTTDLSQNVLNKALEDMIKYSGGKDAAIYSSLSYSGFTSTDLKDYLKLILRKPSSEDKRSLERRRGALLSTEEFANNIARDSWFSVEGVTENDEEINILTSPLKKYDQFVDNIGTTGANFFNNINDTISDKVIEFSKITSQIDEETMSEIYGDDGVVEIFLPLPKEIIEVYAHEIEQAELGGFNQLLNTLEYAKGVGSVAGRVGQAVSVLGGQTMANLAGTLGKTTIPGLQNFITGLQGSMDFVSATTRKAYNPVQEQLYKTPQPRVFQWTIELMPISQDQAKSTAMICQALKEHSSPINIGDLFYDFPGFVEFEFYINNRLATFLPRSLYFDKESKTKVPSFIKSLNIQYSSNNMYSHFVDDYPTNSTITIELLETQPLDRNIIMGDAGNNSVVKGIDKVNNAVSIRPASIID